MAIIFTVTTLTGSLPQAFASSERLNFEGKVKESDGLRKDLYAIPAELGSLVSSWEPPAGTASQEFVVHIQDAHANPEAQKNIAGILKFLAQKYPNLAIGVEGVAGPLHPEYLQFFKKFPEANQAVVDDLLKKGELGGAELYLLQEANTSSVRSTDYGERLKNVGLKMADVERRTQNAVRVSGVEDIDLYRENLKTYRELLFKRDEIQTRLTPLRALLEAEVSRGLNADLLDFLKERKRRKEGKYYPDRVGGAPDLQAYVQYLKKQATKTLQIDLKDPLEQLRFPNLMKMLLAAEVQKSFNAAKAREDWANVLAAMKKNAKDITGQDFVRSLEFWGHENGLLSGSQGGAAVRPATEAALYPRKLLEQLFLFSRKYSISLEGHEPFLRSFELFILQEEVEAAGLLDEMNALEGMLVEKLATTHLEKELVSRLNSFDLLEKILSLELTRDEYERMARESEAMAAAVKNSPELKAALSKAYYFYDSTLLRDRILVENALALGKGNSGKEKRVTVLITGGFHTDGIDAILREQEIGYVTLMPHISRTDRGELYQKVMAEDHADLTAYFKVKNPFATKQEALLFREMIEVATPLLSEKYHMEPASVTAAVAKAVQAHPVLSSSVVVQSSGPDGKALRFMPRTLTSKNSTIASPAITGAISFQRALAKVGSGAGVDFSNLVSGRPPVSYGAATRSEVRENREPLAKRIKNILIVDDEESITFSIKRLLKPAGFEVVTADSGAQALEILEKFTPDAILTDVLMPGMTGPEWVLKAAQMPGLESVPVVFMSAYVGDQVALDQAIEALSERHPTHFLGKPFPPNSMQTLFAEPEVHFKYWPEVRSEVRKPLAKPIQKILVVDDEKLSRDLAVRVLHDGHGFEVVTADSGPRALEMLRDFTPDIVLSDISMPGMMGPEMVQRFSEIPELAKIPVIFLTGWIADEALQKTMQDLAKVRPIHLLGKPFSPSVLKPLLAEPHLNFEYWPEARSEVRENRQPLANEIKKILVVDDEEMVANMAVRQLQRAGFQAESVSSGEEALGRLNTYVPDFILSDVQMPGMTGPEWVLTASKMPGFEHVPVVFMSGRIKDQTAFDLAVKVLREAQHTVYFVDKPYDAKMLVAIFKELEAQRSEVREGNRQPLAKPIQNILVIDNDPNVADVIARMLKVVGFQARQVYSAAEALKNLETWTPDAILTEFQISGMKGTEWVQKMPERFSDIPIVFMMASLKEEDAGPFRVVVNKLAAQRPVHFFRKPIPLEDLEKIFRDPVGEFTFWPPHLTQRSEMRNSGEVERPLEKMSADSVKKVFIFGNQKYGKESMSREWMLYSHFVRLLQKKFPEWELHLAVDYPNQFSSDHFVGKVFPVMDAEHRKNRLPPLEPVDGILKVIPIDDGIIGDALEGKTAGLAMWLVSNHYDMVFDFTKPGENLGRLFQMTQGVSSSGSHEYSAPVVFSHMNPLPETFSTGTVKPKAVLMTDREGARLVKGTDDLTRLTKKGTGNRPVYEELVLRIYREMGLLSDGMDLQTLDLGHAEVSDQERERLRGILFSMFEKKGLGDAAIRDGRKIIFVNTFSRKPPHEVTPEVWLNALSWILADHDAYLVFSQGGPLNQEGRPAVDYVTAELAKKYPTKAHLIMKVPENLSMGIVRNIINASDLVVTPAGLSSIATDLNRPQLQILSMDPDASLERTYRENSMAIHKDWLLDLVSIAKIKQFITKTLDASPIPARHQILGIAEASRQLLRPKELASKRFLLVDDDPLMNMLVPAVLQQSLGVKAKNMQIARNGREALEIFSANPEFFDFIISDVNMPEMTGPEFVAEAMKIRRVPVLFLSALKEENLKDPVIGPLFRSLEVEGVIFDALPKPFNLEATQNALTQLLEKNGANRSEIRSPDEKQAHVFDALQAKLIKQDGKFFDQLGRMNVSAVRTKMSGIWKSRPLFRALQDLFRLWKGIQEILLKDQSVNPKRIQELKTTVDGIFADFEKQHYKGFRADEKTLTPLRNILEKWTMGYYNPTAFRAKGEVSNDALKKYIRKEADAWLVGMLRFIETTPGYQINFLELVKTFPETVLEWSLEPWQTSIDKTKSPEYVLSILNGWHKFKRLPTEELVDLYPPSQISKDRIGVARRRQIFLFAEGLSFMTQAAKGLRLYQGTLPFKGSLGSSQRSELRGSTAEIQESLMQDLKLGVFDQVKTLVPETDIPSIEFAAQILGGLYSDRSIVLLTQDAGKARLWIAMQLIEAMSASEKEGQITGARLSQFLEIFMASIPGDVRTLASRDAAMGPQLHVNLAGLDNKSWDEFVRHFPMVLGLLVTLHASLSINVEAEGETLRTIQKQFDQLMAQEGIVLAPGQLRIVSAIGSDRFKSFEGEKEADAFMARDEKLLARRRNVKSYWVTEDGNRMEALIAGIATALLEVASDAHLNAANTYRPSQYATLLAVVMNAIQGYLRIQTAA
ncbi:MAG: response regulator [Candidatus Omnitrophota bacterium]